mmetsp:Transcript_30858/g.81785  ORF Transcript_30858/g.81785 Transcript_30858/m.81785 type:complete len:106 (+) Transcript_30858:82-399(+)
MGAAAVAPEASCCARDAAADEYTIQLDRAHGGKLGLDVAPEGDTLTVRHVLGGLAQRWNARNPESRVAKGDRIVEVNGFSGDVATLMERCKRDQVLVMRLRRSCL